MDDRPADSGAGKGELLTLEPLLDGVREVVEAWGWTLSGLQKTTSYEFAGRWEGDSTRSAYAFFHREEAAGSKTEIPDRSGLDLEDVALDLFLDETSRGLTGNLALVVSGPPLGRLGDTRGALERLGAVALACAPPDLVGPITLRARLPRLESDAAAADTEVRFKVRLGTAAIGAGTRVVQAVVRSALGAFDAVLGHPDLENLLSTE